MSRPRLEASRQARDYHETAVACLRVKVRQQVRERRSWPFRARPSNVPVASSRAKPSKVPAYLCKPTQAEYCMNTSRGDAFRRFHTALLAKRLIRRARTFFCIMFALLLRSHFPEKKECGSLLRATLNRQDYCALKRRPRTLPITVLFPPPIFTRVPSP